jgi:hypothetical protein
VLDSRGEADVWLDGAYKFVLTDSLSNTIWTVDNITDPTNGATFTNATFAGTTALVNLTVSGTTALGDAVADTLSVSGSTLKNGTGNWTFPAPTAGTLMTLTGLPGATITTFQGGAASDATVIWNLSGSVQQYQWFIKNSTGAMVLKNNISALEPVTVGSAGNITIIAPTAGVGFTQTGFAGSDTALFNGGTSGSFRVTDRGLPYGTSIHNNAGAVTGTTNQYITSGTYMPTFSNGTNVAANTPQVTSWMRVGNVVTVGGAILIDPTAATTGTLFQLSLPIASDLTVSYQLGGAGVYFDGSAVASIAVLVIGDTTNNTAAFTFITSTAVGNTPLSFHFSYVIV